VSELPLDFGFATGCTLIGEGRPADREWTKPQFLTLCHFMLNGNGEHDFLHAYRGADGQPHFAKAKKARVNRRITWAWETITGKAKSKFGIGFYPSDMKRMSRWAAVDFDAHDGGAERVRLHSERSRCWSGSRDYYVILTGSGSHGWHLFILTAEFQQIDYWTLFLKRLTTEIGAPIRPGCCELFPKETTSGSYPYGIRAPGTWNPKTDQLGLIVFNSTGPLLERLCAAKEKPKKERENSPFLYPSSVEAAGAQMNDSKAFYCAGVADWQTRFAISHGGTRHEQLRQLVHVISRQAGYRIARRNAEAQCLAARVQPKATLSEHLEEFDSLWEWNLRHWRGELSGKNLSLRWPQI